jgi:hypothetical protein
MSKPKGICRHCGKPITVVQTSPTTWKWVVVGAPAEPWRCSDDPAYPVPSHQPRPY